MIDFKTTQPGRRSFFAGHLAAWARRLAENRMGAFAHRHVYTAITIKDAAEYERYCGELLTRQLAHEIVKRKLPMTCKTDETKMIERHSIEVVVLTLEEFRRLEADLNPAACVIEELAR